MTVVSIWICKSSHNLCVFNCLGEVGAEIKKRSILVLLKWLQWWVFFSVKQEAEANGLGKVNVIDVEAIDEEAMDQSVTISRGEFKHTQPAPVHTLSGKTGTQKVFMCRVSQLGSR